MKIEETQELSRRATTCKGWRWLPGMLAELNRFQADGCTSVRVMDVYGSELTVVDADTITRPLTWRIRDDGWHVEEYGNHDGSNGDDAWLPVAVTQYTTPRDWLPDLADPATLGCLLQLVREAYADQCACVFPIDYGPAGVMWQVRLTASGRQVTARHYTTEAEALVAALEAVQ